MIISTKPTGNLGNRMIAHMVAVALGSVIDDNVTYNSHLPEWGLAFDWALHDNLLARGEEGRSLITDKTAPSIEAMSFIAKSHKTLPVLLDGYFQRVALLYPPEFYRRIFPVQPLEDLRFDDDEIVINVRAGGIANGAYRWYPLVPPSFYKVLVRETGYRPVFLGQLDDSAYVAEIREHFPLARWIPSAGAVSDFNRLRHAKRICIAVSTFSWLAAWLSEAKEIHYPLLGFLHPGCLRFGAHSDVGIDLVPADDWRYRFHLFPVLDGAPEQTYLNLVRPITPISKQVPRSLAHVLKRTSSILPVEFAAETFDEEWYLRTYIDAAWEIAEGWYLNAAHHYAEIGCQRGYLPYAPLHVPESEEVALHKPASQSSLSRWSIGKTIAEDAGRAVDGDCSKEMAFYTECEDHPWWSVDLQEVHEIECINIYNRRGSKFVRKRILPFAIELSLDGENWTTVSLTKSAVTLIWEGGKNVPYQWVGRFAHTAQFVRVMILRNECLHLAAVQVYGRPTKTLSTLE
jgi:F5/8 type C domain